jgi:hypothetical protein
MVMNFPLPPRGEEEVVGAYFLSKEFEKTAGGSQYKCYRCPVNKKGPLSREGLIRKESFRAWC